MGLVCTPHALAQAPQLPTSGPAPQSIEHVEIADVALQEGGVLMGQVFTPEGTPRVHVPVRIQQNGQTLVETMTDADGKFVAQGLSGGVYQVVVGNIAVTYRLWAPGTAPPSSKINVLLIDSPVVMRGQVVQMLSRPWLVTAGTAAAIAIPIAVTNGKGGS